MKSYARSHLADESLASRLAPGATRIIDALADHLADLGEFDARKLYLPAAYPSMLAYCRDKLPLPENASRKHIHAARTARRFPSIFPALADGRLHLSAVILLAPYLTIENADELLAAATHKSKFEIEQLIAERFPRLDVPTTIHALEEPVSTGACAPGRTDLLSACVPGRTVSSPAGPGAEGLACARTTVTPLVPQLFELSMTIDQETFDQLRYAQALLGHAVPSGDLGAVLKRLAAEGIGQLERHKFAACARSRPRMRAAERRRWMASACCAGRTINTKPSGHLESSSCAASARRRANGHRKGVLARQLPIIRSPSERKTRIETSRPG